MGKRKMGFHKRDKLTAVFALAIAVAGCSSQPRETSQVETDRLNCQKQLRSAAYSVFQYRSDHDEQFPKTLEDAIRGEAGQEMSQRLSECPTKQAAAKYIYIDWSRWFTNAVVPKDYPLLYESKRQQHGDGINIALMDGSAFWDDNARWIIDFAKRHPEYGLEIPR